MTTQQIKNVVDLCKGETLDKVMLLLSLYSQESINDMARYLNCQPTKIDIADKLTS